MVGVFAHRKELQAHAPLLALNDPVGGTEELEYAGLADCC